MPSRLNHPVRGCRLMLAIVLFAYAVVIGLATALVSGLLPPGWPL